MSPHLPLPPGTLSLSAVTSSLAAILTHKRAMALTVLAKRRLAASLQSCLVAIVNGEGVACGDAIVCMT